MMKSLKEIYCDLENWLIQMIDADPDYDYSPNCSFTEYANAMFPNEYALYMAIANYIESKGEEK